MENQNNILYAEEIVLKMLLTAYKAGFEGPLELDEEICRDIMSRNSSKNSDLELMKQVQEREDQKKSRQRSSYNSMSDYFNQNQEIVAEYE